MSLSTAPVRANIRNLYLDVATYGILSGSAIAFVAIFAARLGASALQIGLLTAGPAVVNLLFSLPSARWMQGRSLIQTVFWSALLQRLSFVVMIFLPWLFQDHQQVLALIGLTLLASAPQTVLAISFNAMFADVVPGEFRAEVVGKRNAMLAVTQTISTLISGQVLDLVAFPGNYQIVFGLGAIGAGLSTYYLALLRTAPAAASPPANAPAAPPRPALRPLVQPPQHLDLSLLSGSFGRFMAAYLLFYTTQYLLLPLFPLTFVNTLKLSDGMISLGNGLFYGTMFLASLRLSGLARRFSHHHLLTASGMGLALYPLLLALARGVPMYLAASLVGGAVWGILSASLINRLIERVPEDARPAGMAAHNLVFNLGILIGSLLGPQMGAWLGLEQAILWGALLRLGAGILLIWWG